MTFYISILYDHLLQYLICKSVVFTAVRWLHWHTPGDSRTTRIRSDLDRYFLIVPASLYFAWWPLRAPIKIAPSRMNLLS